MAERVSLWGRDIDEASADLDDGNVSLTFKPAPAPWYRTRRGLVVLIAVIAVAVVLSVVPMLLRSPAPGSEESTNTPPRTAESAPTTAEPTTNSVAPTLSRQPAPPPPPPLPPPPAPAPDAPMYTRQYPSPRNSEPSKPEIGVTRAPISVAPEPRTPPPNDADVGRHGTGSGGFF